MPPRFHRWLLLIVCAWAVSPASVHAQPRPFGLKTEAGVAQLDEARALLYAFRLDEAEARLDRLAAAEPASPAAAYTRAQLRLWRALVTEKEADYAAFHEIYDVLVDKAKALPADGPWGDYLVAEALLMRALALVKSGDYVKAAWAGKKAHDYYHKTVREHPGFAEAYKGTGMGKVLLGSVPDRFGWAMRIVGLDGDVQEGLDEMQRAAERGRYGKPEATLLLAAMDLLMNSGERGELDRLRSLQRTMPAGPFVNYLTAALLMSDRRAAEATRLLEATLPFADDARYQFVDVVYYELGEAYQYQNKFQQAERLYRTYLARHDGPALRAMADLRVGLMLELQGKRDAALPWYRKVKQHRKDYDNEEYAVRQARKLLAAPLTPAERTLHLGAHAFDGGRYAEAAEVMLPLVENTALNAVVRAEAAHRVGRALQESGDYDTAQRYYRFAVSNPGPADARWGPWSQYYLGETLEAMGRHADARTAYEAALAWRGDYDFRNGLEQRAKAALARLRRA